MRSAILVRRKLLNGPFSALPAGFSALPPSACRLGGSPFEKISLFEVGVASLDAIPGIASETVNCAEAAGNIGGACELEHLNQVAASSVLLVDDVLSTGTTAFAGARVFGKGTAKPVWGRTVARKLKNRALDFEAEPEEEFRVPAP